MNSSPTHTSPSAGHSTVDPHALTNARDAYDTYLAESAAAYQTFVASLAAAPSGELRTQAAQHTTAITRQSAAPAGKYWAWLAAARQAGLPAVWAAGLIAARAVIAYSKYVVDLTRAIQSAAEPADAQPMAELSDAERAAAAAAESAAAYQKYVATPAAAVGPSDADRTAETTVTDEESGPPAGWSPAV